MIVLRLTDSETRLKKGIKCITEPDCNKWQKGYIYEVPKDFHVNDKYFKIIKDKKKVKEVK